MCLPPRLTSLACSWRASVLNMCGSHSSSASHGKPIFSGLRRRRTKEAAPAGKGGGKASHAGNGTISLCREFVRFVCGREVM